MECHWGIYNLEEDVAHLYGVGECHNTMKGTMWQKTLLLLLFLSFSLTIFKIYVDIGKREEYRVYRKPFLEEIFRCRSVYSLKGGHHSDMVSI